MSNDVFDEVKCCFDVAENGNNVAIFGNDVERNFVLSTDKVNLWNNLPLSTSDFTSLHRFDKSVSNDCLLVYCKLNFTYR